MPTVRLVDPSLVVLIGPAGSGKSTLAARHFAPDEILSSDAYRKLVSGDEADQRASGLAFRRLHDDVAARLRGRRLSVVDATNLTRHARLTLLARARDAGVPAVAIVLDLPPADRPRPERRPDRAGRRWGGRRSPAGDPARRDRRRRAHLGRLHVGRRARRPGPRGCAAVRTVRVVTRGARRTRRRSGRSPARPGRCRPRAIGSRARAGGPSRGSRS